MYFILFNNFKPKVFKSYFTEPSESLNILFWLFVCGLVDIFDLENTQIYFCDNLWIDSYILSSSYWYTRYIPRD